MRRRRWRRPRPLSRSAIWPPLIPSLHSKLHNGKEASPFYKAVADGLHERVGLRREDVFISLVEVKKENWSFGNGIAQLA